MKPDRSLTERVVADGKDPWAGAGEGADRSGGELRPIRIEKTFVSVTNEIKRIIFAGVLKPGDRLPSELELAERLGVSRSSVREALRGLELSGFLQVQRGGAGGRIIVDTIADSIGNNILDAIQMGKIMTDELTVARVEIESVIVRHAVANADEIDLLLLRQNIENAHEKLSRGLPAKDDNVEFHKLIGKASKNQVLSLLQESLLLILTGSMSRLGLNPGAEKSRKVTISHEAILQAIIARDADAAEEQMRLHLRQAMANLTA
ncbi:MAG: FadR family transcriptional regulator [Desulfuromonadales bacterium]|nr:FadR family transcriptional regulator [Desulfuromonadales bacterium]